jgi:hypothetical protein
MRGGMQGVDRGGMQGVDRGGMQGVDRGGMQGVDRGGMQGVDSASGWSASGSSFAAAPVRASMPAMGMVHPQVPMHAGQAMHAPQQIMQDLVFQIERIQSIMNELNQLRVPNEVMLQLSDYITHLRKQLHQHNLSMSQIAAAAAPIQSPVSMEHRSIMREPVLREALRGEGPRGESKHFSPRQESRGERARGDRSKGSRPNKRQWGQAESSGTYIEREGFVGDANGGDGD